jgi:hypothetical protein
MLRKPIPNFDGYDIDEDGNVWSCWSYNGKKTNEFHLIKPKISDGYLEVGLCRNKKQFFRRIHVLLLETFVGPRPKGMVARHFPDNNRQNNKLNNLQWGTCQENHDDQKINGTIQYGSKNKNSKLVEKDVADILALLKEGKMGIEIAKLYNVSKYTISLIKTGKTWKHVKRTI